MAALYEVSVPEFLRADENLILGHLIGLLQQGIAELSAEQAEAWRKQIPILRNALRSELAKTWRLLLEFPIPRRGKRIDAVVLSRDLILVLEFKCGARQYLRDGITQVEDYCLDLRDFHKGSHGRTIVPILIATDAGEMASPTGQPFDFVSPVWRANATSLATILQQATVCYGSDESEPINPGSWNRSEYLPTPTILEAARMLYDGQDVREISRCHAGAENLTRTSDAVAKAIQVARHGEQKIICFVTGVPGAGKTLAGLNIIHDRARNDGTIGAFLSGNGPLVRVLSEALARDHAKRTKQPLSAALRKTSTFIQNVHRFIDAHYPSSSPPPDRLVVFDEAQRAWNAEQSHRKFERNASESEIMLDIMSRHQGWAVIVALIGSGQEINTGEAGLREWGRALEQRASDWRVFISPVLATAHNLDGDSLFETWPETLQVSQSAALHLNVSIRSYKAKAVSEFVAHLLSFNVDAARRSLADCPGFPITLTRDLSVARRWLRRRQRGTRRIGLVATSGARRLRANGLDVRPDLDVENWFLNGPEDVRSSYYLETPATEFGIQGLELDWIGVCWDLDLVPERMNWSVGAFKGTKWQRILDQTRRQYVVNKYRVLLTRAREGLIICVPEGDMNDWTRPRNKYDAIADYLSACGISICTEA